MTSAPDESRPAPTNARGAPYPRVYPDGRVSFRVHAPTATTVQVQPGGTDNGLGSGPYDMVRDEEGFWAVTIPPAVPGFHYYWLLVDGVAVNDPGSETFFGYNKQTSGVEIPEEGVTYYAPQPVPHGEVRARWYWAKVTETWRRAYVYTPPDYDTNPTMRYPVLYLQHGGGEDERGWPTQGKVNFILDNLIAAGQAKPMIVVMECGYAYEPGQSAPPPVVSVARTRPPQLTTTFPRLVVGDLIPMIDATYRSLADRDHRAMAGLSMGSCQTLQTAMHNLDLFAYIGVFSGPPLANEEQVGFRAALAGVFDDVAAFNARVRLFWFGAGTAEARELGFTILRDKELKPTGIRYTFWQTPGVAHEWLTWRRCLNEFAPQLFRI
jgi:enterochelin esterase-like enzyme